MAEKAIGILGGMGPEATIDLFRKIVAATPARTDQEHLRIIIDNNPKVPNRTAALLHGGEDPTPLLQATARNLEQAGAGFIVIPCNTAHLYFDRILEAVRIPVLHIAIESVKEILRRYPEVRTVGVLGTSGTVKLRLYHDLLEDRGLQSISSPEEDQQIQDAVIHSVKAGDKGQAVRERIREVAERLAGRGAQLLLTACTELPLVLQDGDASVPVLDPTLVLAHAAVHFAQE